MDRDRQKRPDSTTRFRQMKEVQVAVVLHNSTISRFGVGKYSMIKQTLESRVTPSGFLITLVKAFASNTH